MYVAARIRILVPAFALLSGCSGLKTVSEAKREGLLESSRVESSYTKEVYPSLTLKGQARALAQEHFSTDLESTARSDAWLKKQHERYAIEKLCAEIDDLYRRNRWGSESPCDSFENFEVIGWSVQGRPLVSLQFGDRSSSLTTLIQCGIHGDELPSLPMCFRLLKEVSNGNRPLKEGTRMVVQPLLNPDGMLRSPPTRPNARGVDLNRNFPTQDWVKNALEVWGDRDRKDPRKYPGPRANSEPETQAIAKFILENRPQKIIAIHTPLGHLDLDAAGEGDQKRRARFLAINMSKNSGNYRFLTWGVFPGSLGNFAGRESGIPVYTLELPPGVKRPTVDAYWRKFRVALWRAIDFDLDTGKFVED